MAESCKESIEVGSHAGTRGRRPSRAKSWWSATRRLFLRRLFRRHLERAADSPQGAETPSLSRSTSTTSTASRMSSWFQSKPPNRCVAFEHQKKMRLSRSKAAPGHRTTWIHTTQADLFFAGVMVVYSLFVGFELQLRLNSADTHSDTTLVLGLIEAVLSLLFVIEYGLRACAGGLRYVCRPSSIFDACLILASVASSIFKFTGTDSMVAALGVLRVARLLRLCMLARLIHIFPALWLVSQGLARTILSITFAAGPLVLLIYGGAMVCADILGRSSKCAHDSSGEPGDCIHDLFGSVPLGILTNVKLALGEAWPDIADLMFLQSRWWILYIVIFLVLSNVVILNCVAEVICGQLQGIVAKTRPDSLRDRQEARESHARRLGELFDAACKGDNGYLREGSYLELLKSREVHALLRDMDVGLPLQPEEAVALLDQEDNGYLLRKDWVDGVMHLVGTKWDSSSVSLQLDLFDCDRQAISHAETAEHALKSVMKDSVTRAGWAILHQVKALEQDLEDLWLELSSEEHEVASEHCLPDLEKSPKVIKAGIGAPVMCESTRSTPPSSPRSPASELSLPPLEATPAVVRAGLGIPSPERRAPTEVDVRDACAELEASSRLFQNAVAACSWRPRKEKIHAEVATQTEDLPMAKHVPPLTNATEPLGIQADRLMEVGTPVSNHDEDDSMVCELLFPDEDVLPDEGDTVQAETLLKTHINPCEPDDPEEVAVGTPCKGTTQSNMPHLNTHDPSDCDLDTASSFMLGVGEAVSGIDGDASVSLPRTNVDPVMPLTPGSEDSGTNGLEADENLGVPSHLGESQEVGPTTPSNSRTGWASDPHAAQRRREFLASIRRRPGPHLPTAKITPQAGPQSPAMPRDGAATVREEVPDEAATQGQLWTRRERTVRPASVVAAEAGPLALSRRLRAVSGTGPGPLLSRQRQAAKQATAVALVDSEHLQSPSAECWAPSSSES